MSPVIISQLSLTVLLGALLMAQTCHSRAVLAQNEVRISRQAESASAGCSNPARGGYLLNLWYGTHAMKNFLNERPSLTATTECLQSNDSNIFKAFCKLTFPYILAKALTQNGIENETEIVRNLIRRFQDHFNVASNLAESDTFTCISQMQGSEPANVLLEYCFHQHTSSTMENIESLFASKVQVINGIHQRVWLDSKKDILTGTAYNTTVTAINCN